MRVELDMFSGRPNPSWDAPAATGRELAKFERNLVPSRAAPEPPALGYRGFVYGEGRNARRAFGGALTRAGQTFEDPGRRIERLLLATMPEVFLGLRSYLPKDLTG